MQINFWYESAWAVRHDADRGQLMAHYCLVQALGGNDLFLTQGRPYAAGNRWISNHWMLARNVEQGDASNSMRGNDQRPTV